MRNKIPQEIEENRKMCSNWYEEGYNDGFKAGQNTSGYRRGFIDGHKEAEKRIKEMIAGRIKYYEDEEIKQREFTNGYEGLSSDEEGALDELNFILSKIGDVQQSKEKREDE